MSSEGTLIKTRYPFLYFDNVDINSIEEVRNLEDSLDKNFDKIRSKIESLILATPKDITPKGEAPIEYIKEITDEIFDELYEVAKDYYTVDIIKNILEEWSWGGYSEDKNLYKNCEEDNEINDHAFIEDKHIEVKRDMNKFTFAPPDDHINQTITRCIQNIKLNDNLSDWVNNKVVIILHDKLYVDYDGQFLFDNFEKAENVLKKKMDFHALDYISKEFVELHPDYFKTVIDSMKEDLFSNPDNSDLIKFINGLEILKEGNIYKNIDTIDFLYKLFETHLIREVYKMMDIHLCLVKDLINSFVDPKNELILKLKK